MAYQIETDIPVPTEEIRVKNNKYPFARLNVGDSFQYCDIWTVNKYNSIRTRISVLNKENGRQFTFRRYNGGIRVWRIK